jgi:hypothetical protein
MRKEILLKISYTYEKIIIIFKYILLKQYVAGCLVGWLLLVAQHHYDNNR